MNDPLLEIFNEIESFHWWWKGRQTLLKSVLKKYKANIKVLDVGCGTGETLSFLRKTFPRATVRGIDSSRLAVNFSRKKGHDVVLGNAKKLPFSNNSFDFVLMLDVLEHIKDDNKVLTEAKRVLKKNGKILITAPACKLIWSKHDALQGHERRYSKKDLVELAGKNRLKVDYISYFNFFLFLPIAVIRLSSSIPFFSHIADYDNSVNFKIAKFGMINKILELIFVNEIRMLRYFRYPFGVSITTMLSLK